MAKKNMNTLARKVAMNEGLKVEMSIAQIAEVLRVNSMICHQDPEYAEVFARNGARVTKVEAKKNSKG